MSQRSFYHFQLVGGFDIFRSVSGKHGNQGPRGRGKDLKRISGFPINQALSIDYSLSSACVTHRSPSACSDKSAVAALFPPRKTFAGQVSRSSCCWEYAYTDKPFSARYVHSGSELLFFFYQLLSLVLAGILFLCVAIKYRHFIIVHHYVTRNHFWSVLP